MRPDRRNETPLPPLTRLTSDYKTRAIGRGWIRVGNYVWLLAAVSGGFALRVNRLGAQSLWNDEGTSVALSRLNLPAVAAGAASDIHPPLYYVLLHFWMELAGDSEFAVRFLSVLAGALIIVVTFRVARTFFDQEVAVIAAFLSALSVFQLYYSQETRMYAMVTLFSALSVWSMARLLLPSSRPLIVRWIAYAVSTTAALYTHYFSFTLVLFENAAFLCWLILTWQEEEKPRPVTGVGEVRAARQPSLNRFRVLGAWIAVQAVVALAFLPWLAFAGNQLTTWPAISESLSPQDLTLRVLSSFVFKVDAPLGVESWVVAAYAIFFIAGLMPSLDLLKQSAFGILLASLWTLVPLAAMYAVSLQRPAYDPKFLLLATPGFFILAARGLSILSPGFFLRERARRYSLERSGVIRSAMTWQFLLTFGMVAGGALIGARDVYNDSRFQRADYRGIARYIDGVATTRDAVLIDAPGQIEVFRYYYHGAADVLTLPVGRPLQPAATNSVLDTLARFHNLYAVFWATDQADPGNVVESYLGAHSFKASDEWHGDVRLAQYLQPSAVESGGLVTSGERFGGEIELVHYDIGAPTSSLDASGQARSIRAGRILPIELLWLALKRPASNYKVFVHLLDDQGKLVAQRDMEPVGGTRPTGTWDSGERISDLVGLLIPPGTLSRQYSIELGLYRQDDGSRLELASGADHLVIATVGVEQ